MSIKIFDAILSRDDMKNEFAKTQLGQQDIIFIKELITGKPIDGKATFQGRPCSEDGEWKKYFLYQVY